MTGLWQVSGRSGISYAERVRLDAYYVRNWSVWLDIYILLKTPGKYAVAGEHVDFILSLATANCDLLLVLFLRLR